MQTNTGITIYNKYVASNSEVYSKHKISRAEWENRKASNVLATGGNIAADQAVLFIPFTGNTTTFLKPKEWQALENEIKEEYWTLQVGDIIVKGLVDDVITVGFSATDLKKKYDDVLTISTIDTMDIGSAFMNHWEVGLR